MTNKTKTKPDFSNMPGYCPKCGRKTYIEGALNPAKGCETCTRPTWGKREDEALRKMKSYLAKPHTRAELEAILSDPSKYYAVCGRSSLAWPKATELIRAELHARQCAAENFFISTTRLDDIGQKAEPKKPPFPEKVQSEVADLWHAARSTEGKPPLRRNFFAEHAGRLRALGIEGAGDIKRCLDAARKNGLLNKWNEFRRKSGGKDCQV